MSHDIFYFGVHFLMVQPSLLRRVHHSLCHRMWEMLFQAGGDPKRLVLRIVSEYHNFFYRGLRFCERSGLVKDDCVRLRHGFQEFSAFHGDPAGPCLPDRGQDGERHCKLQRAGEVDHKDRQRLRHAARQKPRRAGADQCIWYKPVRQMLGFALNR